MARCVALLVVVLAVPARVWSQGAAAPAPADNAPPTFPGPAAIGHIRRGLETPAPLRDATIDAPPTFRVSVWQERIDITRFWGDPDAVGANVHAPGGPWHHEFQNMVVPDEFRGWGYTNILDNREMANVAFMSTELMLAVQYLPVAVKTGLERRGRRLAREEVQRELAEFFATHPEARPPAQP